MEMLFDDVKEVIIMKPKARRLAKYKQQKKYKTPKTSSNNNFINALFWRNSYESS